jgi:poly-gamma-glutamate synthesis protein (capsule biosynthesis protein)
VASDDMTSRLSRRGLLRLASTLGSGIALGSLGGALTSSASQIDATDAHASSTGPLVVAYHEPCLPSVLGSSLARLLDGTPGIAMTEATPFATTSDIYLGTTPPPDLAAREVGRLDFVPVTHYRRWERSVSRDALRAIFAAGFGSWSALGGKGERLELVVDRQSVPLIARALGAPAPRVPGGSGNPQRFPAGSWADRVHVYETTQSVVEHVSTSLNALGILPAAALSFETRPLAVDGAQPLKAGDAWPLSAKVWLGSRSDALSADRLTAYQQQLGASLARPPDAITLTAVGDVMFGRRTDLRMVTYNDYTRPFHDVAKELSSADITVGNMENPISDRITVNHNYGTYVFGTSTKATKGLNFAGFDAVSLANNHTLNSGVQPLLDTFKALDAAGVKYFGAGPNIAAARRPAIVEAKGVKFAFLGYDDITGNVYGAGESKPGNAPLNVKNMVADIQAARDKADVVIPFFHWGIEYELYPNTRQRDVAKAAVEAGAGLVLGSHPHWVQTVEFYQGVLIAYSLGNFVFDQPWWETQQGIALRTRWRGKKLASFDILPVHIHDMHQPRWLDPMSGEGRQIVERLYDASMTNFRRKS